jgi:hypothetical protein
MTQENLKLRLSPDEVEWLVDLINCTLWSWGMKYHHSTALKQLRSKIIEQTEKRGHQFDSSLINIGAWYEDPGAV